VAAAAAAIEGEIPPQNLATFANPKTVGAVVALRWMPSRAESWRRDWPSSVASAISTPWVPGLDTDAAHPPLKLACDVRAELRQQKWYAFVERGNASRMILHAPRTSTFDDSHVQ
jgi:hypothetical protein